jgi:hypothetical protein
MRHATSRFTGITHIEFCTPSNTPHSTFISERNPAKSQRFVGVVEFVNAMLACAILLFASQATSARLTCFESFGDERCEERGVGEEGVVPV